MLKKSILKGFQVSGALTFGIRSLSRRLLRSESSPLGRLPEFLKSFEYVILLPMLLSGCAVPVVGGIGVVGMSAVEDRGLGGVASDQALRVKVNYELSDKLFYLHDFELTVYKGRVLITGIAPDEKTKVEAIRLIKGVSGVTQVIDGLNIKGEEGFSEYTRDAWMTTKLKAALYADQDIYAPNYVVKTFDKTIYIFGTAPTAGEQQSVLDHGYEIIGVKKVVNLMDVRQGIEPSK
jgi:osmotically-inducible protein OsmY